MAVSVAPMQSVTMDLHPEIIKLKTMLDLFDFAPAVPRPLPVPERTLVDILTDAHTLLRTRGWAQGVAESRTGKVCLGFALGVAAAGTGGFGNFGSVCREVMTTINRDRTLKDRLRSRQFKSVPRWNDQHGRTFEEVLGVIEKTIDRLKEQGS